MESWAKSGAEAEQAWPLIFHYDPAGSGMIQLVLAESRECTMDTTIKYAALVIFLIVVIAVLITLRDGFPIGRGRNGGPVVDGHSAVTQNTTRTSVDLSWRLISAQHDASI